MLNAVTLLDFLLGKVSLRLFSLNEWIWRNSDYLAGIDIVHDEHCIASFNLTLDQPRIVNCADLTVDWGQV